MHIHKPGHVLASLEEAPQESNECWTNGCESCCYDASYLCILLLIHTGVIFCHFTPFVVPECTWAILHSPFSLRGRAGPRYLSDQNTQTDILVGYLRYAPLKYSRASITEMRYITFFWSKYLILICGWAASELTQWLISTMQMYFSVLIINDQCLWSSVFPHQKNMPSLK